MPELKAALIGILNITPDSFSDGGLYDNPEAALARAIQLVADGATVIDIGAESTRPGAIPLTAEDEWKRLSPVLDVLRDSSINAWLSIDTRHPENAAKAMYTGIDWVNDVSGLSSHKMIETVVDNAVNIVLMHNMGIPANPNKTIPKEVDPVKYVIDWAKKKIIELEKKGIEKDRIIFDPGIGFGKTTEQSYEIIKRIDEFTNIGTRLLVGHSRKSFLSLFTDKKPRERDPETAIFSSYLVSHGVDFLRIHNIKVNKEYILNRPNESIPELKAA